MRVAGKTKKAPFVLVLSKKETNSVKWDKKDYSVKLVKEAGDEIILHLSVQQNI